MGSVNEHIPERLEFAKSRVPANSPWYALCHPKPWVHIGERCQIGEGTAIGESGFSWAFEEDLTPFEMYHYGGVKIGNDVRIGANCTIDRATLEGHYTILEDHVKLDNQIHIGHNCHIGEKTIIAACAEFSGGVIVGACCWIGPNVSIKEHVKIGKHALVGIGAVVLHDVPDNAVVAGNPARILRYREAVC